MDTDDLLERAIIAQVPALIKARPAEAGGRRIVEVEASTEVTDIDGDVVLQDALLKSASSFIATGHLDIDHLSEFGHRMGIPDPSSYIIGRPLDVRSGPNRTTFVEGEISKAIDGRVDTVRNRFDEFWQSLQRNPPVVWFSSIYGWPTDFDDFTAKAEPGSPVKRYLIKAIDWRSLAFTRSPKNTALTGQARIITAKSYVLELAKAYARDPEREFADMIALAKAASCPLCSISTFPSLQGYRQHFIVCKGVPIGLADVYAHAAMHKVRMQRAFPVNPRG
jgi:hypothetical protein